MHVATQHLSQGWLSGEMASHNDLWIISVMSAILLQHRLNTWESEQQVALKQAQETDVRFSPRAKFKKQMLGCTMWT